MSILHQNKNIEPEYLLYHFE